MLLSDVYDGLLLSYPDHQINSQQNKWLCYTLQLTVGIASSSACSTDNKTFFNRKINNKKKTNDALCIDTIWF